MKAKTKKRIANTVIAIGLVLVLVGGGYELANYPWRLALSKLGILSIEEDLPDPKPLPADLTVPFDADAVGEQKLSDEELQQVAEGKYVMARPKIDLMQLGTIKLPKISITENIVEGTKEELLYGVGHVRTTALPGQEGNCVLAGHRNYIVMHPFRHLDKVEVGDKVILSDAQNTYTYEVFKTFVSGPEERSVMGTQEEEPYMLTLITCTPVINPTQRLIVWARLTETVPIPGAAPVDSASSQTAHPEAEPVESSEPGAAQGSAAE